MSEAIFDYNVWRAEQQNENLDRALLVWFEKGVKKVNKGGEIVFEDVDMVHIRSGKNSEVVKPASDEDKKRFARQYEAYLEGREAPVDGMPVAEWAELSPAQVATLKAHKLYSVEQLADCPDNTLPNGYIQLKYKARDFLEQAKSGAALSQLREQLDEKEKIIESLKDKMANVDLDEVEKLRKDNLLLRGELEELKRANTS